MVAALLALALFAQPEVQRAHAATYTVNATGDASDAAAGNGVCLTATPGECTLRAAIQEANAHAGTETIAFSIPGAGAHTIQPASVLPTLTQPVVIDGTTQPGFAGSPIIELNGTSAGSAVSGITLDGGDSVVRGLVINRFSPAANIAGGGVYISSGGNNVIEGNYIGTDVTGTLARGNSSGVWISGTGGNRVGGTTAAARNIIADNKGPNGAGIWTVSPSNLIEGNYIGTDVTGTIALRNGFGLMITGSNNVIGGTSPGARNLISGNQGAGLEICAGCGAFPTTGNIVQGNYIGTDAGGTTAVPNGGGRGAVVVRASGNTIGGTAPGASNVISGNTGDGVVVGVIFGTSPPPANDNLVAGNLIGTAPDGVSSLGNTGHGVHIGVVSPALRNTIGGTDSGAANTIAHNGQAGVFVESNSNQNPILRNSIFANGGLGIDLVPSGVTANDPGDADTGANNRQNFPVLTSASSSGGSTTVNGTLNSVANTTFRLEFFSNTSCDPSNSGEGETFLGFANVTTDASGNASFTASVGGAPAGQPFITSTATDPANNTSEFSNCITTDYDGDGLADSVDLSPFTFSDAFSDVPLGGTTFGSIANRNGCYVSVVDSPYPAPNDGVVMGNTCPGGGPATIAVSCPEGLGTLTIPDGGLIVGTCGSFYYGTISGKTYFTFQSFYNGVLREAVLTEDPGETSVVADNGDGSVSVINTSLNGDPITVTYGSYTVTMPPDTACIVYVLPSGEFQVTNATQNSTADPITVNEIPVQRNETVTLPPPVGGISETPDVSTLPSVASAPGGRNTLWVVSAALGLAGLAMVAGWKLRRRWSAS